MPNGYSRRVSYHMWAGGGGAGGDSGALTGGNGSAGTYITGTFNADPGDRVEVVVGGGGQEGRSLDANKKIYSCTVEGTGSSGVGPTASYGFVNDPTKAIYPQYNDPLATRTFDKWNSFMNAWAVSNLPSNRSGTEEVTNTIYFPEAGDYKLQIAADNEVTWSIGDFTTTTKGNFANGPFERTIRVAGPGTAELRYTLTNYASSSGNPAGCAVLITRSPPSYMGGGGVETYPGKANMKNVIWSTRFGPNVDVTDRVPLLYAPVVNFYQPQSDYNWSGVPEVGLCFISDNSTWRQAELERLNLNFNKIISISYPVTITGNGNIDQVCATGYYTFKRGQTWELARYNWLGNPTRNNNMTGRGTGTPSNWTERQWFNDGANNRSKNKEFAKWQLPVPPADTLYIVGYADGVIYNSPSQRGSDNVTWTVNSTVSQFYAGGAGGKSATNEGNGKFNYYGGYGGQIGTNQTSGGGGGGGGASYIAIEKVSRNRVGVAIAGGGAGGGGAGFKGNGNNGNNDYLRAGQPNPNSIGAGAVGASAYNTGGGGGGGGGGCDGASGGKGAPSGVGSGGDGGNTGGSQVVTDNLNPPLADFTMVGRGGDGGSSGGGGGAGALMEGTVRLRKYQYIQVGGTDDAKFTGGVSAIWFNDKEYITAGPGGRGGTIGASWSKTGNGQAGGCQSDNTNTNTTNGSGGGAGTGSTRATASGGPGKESPSKVNASTQSKSYQNSGGNSAGGPSWSPGGGGGAGGNGLAGIAGIVGGTGARGGDGGPGRTVSLGKTGKSYTLAGGGGGAAGYYQRGPYAGQGQAGGGDGATGSGPEIEFEKAQLYTIWVPRGVTSMNFEGVGAGGGGGTDSVRGAGGGGSGAWLARTSYVVTPGQQIDIIVGPGGASGTPGGNTRIKFYAKGSVPESNVTLQGGSTGANTGTTPQGGNGGSPNGQTGGNGGQGDSPNFQSGSGASSPYGEGGSAVTVTNKTEKPGAGGRGAGGGGGRNGVPGGRGGDGYVSVSWTGSAPIDAQPNTGSGGGGDFGGNGAGGTGFVAIAYAGAPQYTHLVDRRPVPPIQQNGYTIHEFRQSGELVFEPDATEGSLNRGSGVTPSGTDQPFYIPGVAYGGVGNNNTDVFPVRSSSYNDFLNTYGVWNENPTSSTFDRTYSVYIAKEASYQIQAAADNGGQVFIDGGIVIDMTPADRDNGSHWQKNTTTNVKKLSVGMHTLNFSATNFNLQGAFGLTIVEAGTQNFVFNSRRPPVPAGSPQGGDGLCVLEFVGGEGTAKIKENNAWKQIIGQWVKIDGAWKKILGSATKVNGTWRSLFGAAPIVVTIDPNNFGGPPVPPLPTAPPPPEPEPDTGGGGGGCKIICTVLHDLGLLPDNIYAADEKFGEMLRDNDPHAYYGYVKWASVVVDWIEESGPQCMFWIRDQERRDRKQRELALRWAHRIATPWAQHMAYRMGVVEQDSRAGRWIMNTGLAISRAIGKVTGTKEPSKSVTLGYAMWTVFAVFWLLAGVKGQ